MTLSKAAWLFLIILIFSPFSANALEPDADAIMHRVVQRFLGHHQSAQMEMTLIDQFGAEKKYAAHCFASHDKQTLNTLLVFTSPENVKGTAFLSHDPDLSNNDSQWLYFPALKKTSEIEQNVRTGSFMGSDFSFNDLNRIYPDNYVFQIIDESTLDSHDIWRIKATPKSADITAHDGYEKSVYDIRKDNFVIVRSVHWLKGAEGLKYYVVKDLEKISNIWVATERHMFLKIDGKIRHKTIIRINNLKFNREYNEDIFSSGQMEKKSALVCGGLK